MENCKYLNLNTLQRILYSLDMKLKLNGHGYLNDTKPKGMGWFHGCRSTDYRRGWLGYCVPDWANIWKKKLSSIKWKKNMRSSRNGRNVVFLFRHKILALILAQFSDPCFCHMKNRDTIWNYRAILRVNAASHHCALVLVEYRVWFYKQMCCGSMTFSQDQYQYAGFQIVLGCPQH